MDRLASKRIIVVACALVVGLALAGWGSVIYVDDDAVGADDGVSWAGAFMHLQDALAAAKSGDEIRVAGGVYKPDQGAGVTVGDREATFRLVSGVTLAGGYAGLAGTDPNERDVERHETVLSGDLNGDDGEVAEAHHLAESSRRDDNSISVVVAEGAIASVLDGFTIRDGHVPEITGGHATDGGGGLRITDSSLIVRRCTFSHNWAPEGGAAFIRHTPPDTETLTEIQDSTFLMNASGKCGGALFAQRGCLVLVHCELAGNCSANGGAMYTEAVDLSLCGCAIRENAAVEEGGGLLHVNGNLTVTDCVFVANDVQRMMAPVARSRGGAMAISVTSSDQVSVADCLFRGNRADRGGAIAGNLSRLVRCRFSGNTAYQSGAAFYANSGLASEQCLFVGNRVLDDGAVIQSQTPLLLTNTTFAENQAPNGSLLRVASRTPANVVLLNSIVWDETPVFEDERVRYMDLSVSYCDVLGGWPGEGNLDVDPLFAAPGYWDPNGTPEDPNDDVWVDGDYHLQSQGGRWDPINESWVRDGVTSPCIDAGDPLAPVGDEPVPNGGIVNLGAYGGTAEASKTHCEPGPDPLFVDPPGADGVLGTEDDDFRLTSDSPAIDSGSNRTEPPLPSSDLDGRPRVVNGIVDMGAYEFSGAILPGETPRQPAALSISAAYRPNACEKALERRGSICDN
ncbi:MAG TPA: choice-of-anchor Q domain-containing protein [Sedimentisphaerales bacterium]|nr:choice-of-anchor Q domain-containing protein [Sedimentisphaerales bacterium]HRS09893.1 choice-of-anchor Q domain-containing protein [Sedimentisphaerales bacterium]HRV46457.1 choice-of-anchor Q domain-containing protein [Sedimentisphaerales bacterium]